MADLTAEEIRTKAAEPQSVASDGMSVNNRSGSDFIALDKYANAKAASLDPFGVLRGCQAQIKPPGAV